MYGVHVVMPGEVRPTAALFSDEARALEYASTDDGVLGATVTKFVIDQLGSRGDVVLYVAGQRQALPFVSDDRTPFGGGRKH